MKHLSIIVLLTGALAVSHSTNLNIDDKDPVSNECQDEFKNLRLEQRVSNSGSAILLHTTQLLFIEVLHISGSTTTLFEIVLKESFIKYDVVSSEV
jgi:hypothetical protein